MNKSTSSESNVSKKTVPFLILAILLAVVGCRHQKPAEKSFPTADDAVVALVDAVNTNNTAEVAAILGPDASSAIASGDDVADRYGRDLFLAAYSEQASLYGDDNTKTLYVGSENWPFPIPVVKEANDWRFDTASGLEELRYRRIGRNEFATIDTCRSYYDAQKEYAQKSHDGKPAGVYAQKFVSETGKQDGLFWNVKEGEEPSPLGELAAEATAEGYTRSADKPTPFRGYYFRILTAQGANATGGARSYIENGLMRNGFALVAYPAEYRNSGVMTFLVNQDGTVLEKDLGPDTAKVVSEINQFDPDSSWHSSE
jgi:hypothetical protein